MSEEKWAIITGADGGMGTEITRAVAAAGYHVIMACYHPEKAELVRQRLVNETGNTKLEVMAVDLSSMSSAASLADQILERHLPVSLLMNNAGTMDRSTVCWQSPERVAGQLRSSCTERTVMGNNGAIAGAMVHMI